MVCSMTSVTTVEQIYVNHTSGILVYSCVTRHDLNQTSLLFLITHFESVRRLFCGKFILLDFFSYPQLYYVPALILDGCAPTFTLFWIFVITCFLKSLLLVLC